MASKIILTTILLFFVTSVKAKEWQLEMPTYSKELKHRADNCNYKSDEDLQAYVDLAICYGYGIGVKQDVKKCNNMFGAIGFNHKAYYFHQLAADFPYAAFWYGKFMCDNTGEYTAKQLKWLDWNDRAQKELPADGEMIRWRGLNYIFAAAEDGNLFDAMMFAARTERNINGKYSRDTMRGKGYNESVAYASSFGYFKEAMKLYQKACETGNIDAMLEYACYLIDMVEQSEDSLDKTQSELAVYWIRTAAENGCPEAQWIYGNMYSLGWQYRIEKNRNKALEWYRKSADNGYPKAMGDTGKSLLSSSLPEDVASGLRYLKMGVDGLDGLSACELGKYYKSENPQTAYEYFVKAGELNYPEGLYELGQCHHNGLGVSADLKAAAQAYEKCADLLDVADKFVGICARILSKMYETGEGVFMNKDKASHYRWIAELYDL